MSNACTSVPIVNPRLSLASLAVVAPVPPLFTAIVPVDVHVLVPSINANTFDQALESTPVSPY